MDSIVTFYEVLSQVKISALLSKSPCTYRVLLKVATDILTMSYWLHVELGKNI
jgi:hypothetical protein